MTYDKLKPTDFEYDPEEVRADIEYLTEDITDAKKKFHPYTYESLAPELDWDMKCDNPDKEQRG